MYLLMNLLISDTLFCVETLTHFDFTEKKKMKGRLHMEERKPQRERQTDRQTETETEVWGGEKQKETETDRQGNGQRQSETDRKIDRTADRKGQRQTETENDRELRGDLIAFSRLAIRFISFQCMPLLPVCLAPIIYT